MAQKKVILKDGSDDLLPKTLASMVFTEAGQTVEAALQSAGGGGSSSGGGTGNVNVTNGSGLQKDAYYAFQPSAAGSLTGKFATIPTATEEKAGLISAYNMRKLGNMKSVIALPIEVADYDENTPSGTIEAMLSPLLGEGIVPTQFLLIASALGGEYNADNYKFYIGEYECLLSGSVEASENGSDSVSATLEFSYVSQGKLRTIAITLLINGVSPNFTYTYSAKKVESGDDTYFLGSDLINLETNSTHEDILAAFGGNLDGIIGALKAKKKIFVFFSSLGIFNSISPVSAFSTGSFLISVFFPVNNFGDIHFKNVICSASNSDQSRVHNIYPSGYPLKHSLYSLTSSSSTDDISSAVGGESGLKEIIQAVKDGNRLVIRGTMEGAEDGTSLSTDVVMNAYSEKENGDLVINYSLFGAGQGGSYYGGSYYVLQYFKSSNTFSIQKLDI